MRLPIARREQRTGNKKPVDNRVGLTGLGRGCSRLFFFDAKRQERRSVHEPECNTRGKEDQGRRQGRGGEARGKRMPSRGYLRQDLGQHPIRLASGSLKHGSHTSMRSSPRLTFLLLPLLRHHGVDSSSLRLPKANTYSVLLPPRPALTLTHSLTPSLPHPLFSPSPSSALPRLALSRNSVRLVLTNMPSSSSSA